MTPEERQRRRFSEEFRRDQVALIESGKKSISEVCKLYEVKRESVTRWVKRFGTQDPPKMILITDGTEYGRIKELEKKNRQLMEIIGKQQVELIYNSELLRLAEAKLGENFKKK